MHIWKLKRRYAVCALFVLCGCAIPTAEHDRGAHTPTIPPVGVVGKTLCVNARAAPVTNTYAHIESILGIGAVESPSDSQYVPPRPHIAERSDAVVGPYFAFLAIEPTDVNQDLMTLADGGDRSRTEIKIAPSKGGIHDTFKAREGETFTYTWRFRIDPAIKFSPSFTHIHQLKAFGGGYADPPLITFTPLASGQLEIRHVGDAQKGASNARVIGAAPLVPLIGQWLDVTETVTFSNTAGRYALRIRDPRGQNVLEVVEGGLSLWRTGADHIRPKWGIYRRHHAMLNQHIDDFVHVANIGITRGERADSNCR